MDASAKECVGNVTMTEKGPTIMTREEKNVMTVVLIKLLVCPRLRDDHSGRLVVSQQT